jgi:hypothetical protein
MTSTVISTLFSYPNSDSYVLCCDCDCVFNAHPVTSCCGVGSVYEREIGSLMK